MKGTGAKRNVCRGSCVSTGAKFPVAPVESAPMFRPALCFIFVYNCGLTVRNKRICYVMLCLPLCRRQAEPHAQIQKWVDGIGDKRVKSDRSVVVLHRFGLGRTIGFKAAVSHTSGGKHPESSHQLVVRLRSNKWWTINYRQLLS